MTFDFRIVSGRITQKSTQQPIHGLLVRAVARFGAGSHSGKKCRFDLGCDLTDSDGRYTIVIEQNTFTEYCKCIGHLEFRIKIFDRDGHRIHAERRKAEDCPTDSSFRFDVQIKARELECHLARPLSWEKPTEKLLPDTVPDDIEEAIELVGVSGQSSRLRLGALICARPTLGIFNDVLSDAWWTLNGDLEAAARYRDVLDAICACGSEVYCCSDDGAHEKAIDDVLSEKCEVDPCRPVKLRHKSPCCDSGPTCPERSPLISDDKAALLVMAALHISCRHKETMRTYLVALLDQLCRFQFLGALHKAAVDTICEKSQARQHFRNLLEYLACKCDHDSRGYDCDTVPCCEICIHASLLDCVRDAYLNWCGIECYKITHVSPPRACPGDKVVICGCGFGNEPGLVRFIRHGSMNPGPLAEPELWSDERICVEVPEEAGCGLTLETSPRTLNVCDRFLDYRLNGAILHSFEGTSANILKFIIKGHQNDDCLLPGEVLQIRWKTCATDQVVVRIIDADTGSVIAELDPAPARGRWDFEDTDFDRTTRLRIEIVAHGQCEPPSVSRQITLTFQNPPDLSIDGVEITQAIQYYRATEHLTDPGDRGPDNSLQQVANKSAWVRTYLRSGQDPSFDNGQLGNVGGTLTVERRVNGIWSVVANLVPVNAPVTAQDSFANYNAERADIDATLNFVVPANVMTGLLRFTITVSSPDDCYGGSDTTSRLVDVDLDQELQIAAVSVGYNGPPIGGGANVSFPAPTVGQIATEAGFSLLVYPVRNSPNIRIIDTQNATQPLNNNNFPAGGCDPNWTPILTLVANARTNDGNQAGWFYYGFVSASIPRSHGNVGCASGGNGAGLLGGGTTLAHEIGHQAQLRHAPCGAVGTVTPGFPLYEPYDTGVTSVNAAGNTVYQDASIGEYGLNISDGTIFNPNPARPNNGKDLMSYCGAPWVSIFLYDYMVNRPELNPVSLATGVSGDGAQLASGVQVDTRDEIRPFITIVGTVSAREEVEVSSLVRLPTRELIMTGARTDLAIELIGDKGEVVTSAPVFTIDAHEGSGCGCDRQCKPGEPPKPPFAFIAAMPDVTVGRAIRIRAGENTVWERTCPRATIKLSDVKAEVRKNKLRVSWSIGKKTAKAPEVWLRWSDDGEHWHGLAVGLSGTSTEVDPSVIPAGKIMLQAVAHDGYRSASANSEFVELPDRPAQLAILHPVDMQRFEPGSPLHLWGASPSQTTPKDPTWYIDGKKVGSGLDTWAPLPGSGKHKVELRAKNSESASVQIVVGARPD